MNPILWVFRKEAREMLRDKRTRGAALFGPIFLMIFFVCGMGSVIGSVAKKENFRIHYVKSDNPIIGQLKEDKMSFQEVGSVEEGERLIRESKALVVLQFGPPPTGSGQLQSIDAYFDPKAQRLKSFLEVWSNRLQRRTKSHSRKSSRTTAFQNLTLSL